MHVAAGVNRWDHVRAAFGDEAGVVSFAASDVEAGEAVHVGEHFEEGRGVQTVAAYIVAFSRELRPCFGVLIPVSSDFFVIHASPFSSLCVFVFC